MTPPVIPEARVWQRIRRYAVPAAMIEACTAARQAGDWRRACAAARIDIAFDLAEVRREHGARQAELIEADLAVLAPDLLRWHLPRVLGGRTSLATSNQFLLSIREGRLRDTDAALALVTPKTVDGSQRMRLSVRPVPVLASWRSDLPPVFWSAAHVTGLAAAYGGSAARLPGFEPDGSIRPFAAYTTTPDPADPASRLEAFDRHIAAGNVIGAWAVAGIELARQYRPGWGADAVIAGTVVPFGLDAELARLHARYGVTQAIVVQQLPVAMVERRGGGGVSASIADYVRSYSRVPGIAAAVHERPADLELIRHGLLEPAELHPLVRRALFPGALAAAGYAPAAVPALRVSVPVRCHGEWHRVVHGDGRLEPVSHTGDEVDRERVLHSLGGRVAGCFAAVNAWHGSGDRLPRRLRELRREVLLRIQHGGSAALAELLDAGLDPRMADGRGGTLLHHLRAVRDVALVRRLVGAGVPVDATNRAGRTALHVAIGDGGTPEMVRALLEAGASPHARDGYGITAAEFVEEKVQYHDGDDEAGQRVVRIHDAVKEWTNR